MRSPDLDTFARAALALEADAVLLRWILTRSSWYWAVDFPSSSRRSRNSVSPSRRRIVSQFTGEGLQTPSPWSSTLESTMKTADFLSSVTPRYTSAASAALGSG